VFLGFLLRRLLGLFGGSSLSIAVRAAALRVVSPASFLVLASAAPACVCLLRQGHGLYLDLSAGRHVREEHRAGRSRFASALLPEKIPTMLPTAVLVLLYVQGTDEVLRSPLRAWRACAPLGVERM
jgi:hypothetical protein